MAMFYSYFFNLNSGYGSSILSPPPPPNSQVEILICSVTVLGDRVSAKWLGRPQGRALVMGLVSC